MTYRRDSDIPFLYGHVNKVKAHPENETELDLLIDSYGKEHSNMRGNKTKPVAWFVSQCGSANNRMEYVKELQKYIQVNLVFLIAFIFTSQTWRSFLSMSFKQTQ